MASVKTTEVFFNPERAIKSVKKKNSRNKRINFTSKTYLYRGESVGFLSCQILSNARCVTYSDC